MAPDDDDTDRPRPARGLSFWAGWLGRAFATVFAAEDHPARRPLAPRGFPLAVTARIERVTDDTLHLAFLQDGATCRAEVPLASSAAAYCPGDTRPLFLDPETRRARFGAEVIRYRPEA